MANEPQSDLVVPLVEERLIAQARTVERDGLRIRTHVGEEVARLKAELWDEDLAVERVRVERWVERPEAVRIEDGVVVVPLHEEVPVLETRLRVVEEVRIVKRSTRREVATTAAVRREEAFIERMTNPEEPAAAAARPSSGPEQGARDMATTIIGTFQESVVDKVMAALHDEAQFDRERIRKVQGDVERGIAELVEMGVDQAEAENCAAGLREGRALVLASGSKAEVKRAQTVMERFEDDAVADAEAEADGEVEARATEVEEDLTVAKRQVERGGKRLVTVIHEEPVERTVSLQEERIEVDRQPADRAATSEEAERAFGGKEVEVRAFGEELEVRKEARVTGEVVVRKEGETREEKVEETVRRTEVRIEDAADADERVRT